MMHRAGDIFGHKHARINFHECENASLLIEIIRFLFCFLLGFFYFFFVTVTEL